jgi:segregation and condensation protein A
LFLVILGVPCYNIHQSDRSISQVEHRRKQEGASNLEGPIYHLEGVVKAREENMEDFVGPLDLILHLLSKNKMEIKDIQISLILEQYLDWMNRRKELDLEVASEFVTMASHLIYIKTRMLLSINDEEAMSEMEQLIATLEAHQRNENYLKIKEVVPALDDRYRYGRDYLVKTPESIQPDKTYRYVHQKEDLHRAMLQVLQRTDHKLPPPVSAFQGIVGREPYPVADKAGEIVRRLIQFGVTRFRALFRGNRSRSEVVATFLAILELCKAHRVRLAGTEEDCTITVTHKEEEPVEVTADQR